MTHDIRIGEKSIKNDYEMFIEDVDLGTPSVQTNYITIPGRDGVLDYSEAVAGRVSYSNREVVLSLVAEGLTPAEIDIKKNAVISDIHGKVVKVYPAWQTGYYQGRAMVTVEDYRPNFVRLVVNIDADPFRVTGEVTLVPEPDEEDKVYIYNKGDKPAQLTVTVSKIDSEGFVAEVTITDRNNMYTISEGKTTIPVVINGKTQKELKVEFNDNTHVQFSWNEGYL